MLRYHINILVVVMITISTSTFAQTSDSPGLSANNICRDCPFPMFLGPEVPFPLREAEKFLLEERGTPLNAIDLMDQEANAISQLEIVKINTPVPSYILIATGTFPDSVWRAPRLVRSQNFISDGTAEFNLVALGPITSQQLSLTYKTAVTFWPSLPQGQDVRRIRVLSKGGRMEKDIP